MEKFVNGYYAVVIGVSLVVFFVPWYLAERRKKAWLDSFGREPEEGIESYVKRTVISVLALTVCLFSICNYIQIYLDTHSKMCGYVYCRLYSDNRYEVELKEVQ